MARMGMDMGMGMRGEQQMLLQPRMLQSIQVLAMPSLTLDGWLLEAAERNEALCLDGPGPSSSDGGARRGTRADSDAHDEMLRNQPDRLPSLADVVEGQLATAELDPELADWVRLLVGCLDERGFLAPSDDQLLALAIEHGLTDGEHGRDRLGPAIAALQRLEPRGIGARDAIEALLLQLDPDDPDYSLLCALLEDFVEELAKNKLPAVARALDLDVEELTRLIDTLRELDPRPASRLVEQSAPVVIPDVLVETTGNGYEVTVARSALPAVGIDPDVASLAKDTDATREVRSYARKKVEEARWIVEAIEQRGVTLLRVARAVFEHQHEFLERGPGHLVPLRMGAVAEELELHLSTISRAVAEKYSQTPWGIFPLRSFFQARTGGDDGPARDDARELVRKVVAEEDKSAPLSDDDIAAELERRGLSLARRTVAKYRKELGLPSSYRRRQY
ncbi:MAG: RNA polymerase factor sigma-54 [bacterium]|nr:RNA polymerase factor sigma-54 [bacterium]